MYSNLPKEAKVLGRLELTEKDITDYALVFGQNAKQFVYEPLLNKFETLKQKISEEAIIIKNEVKNEQQEVNGGGEPESDPFWQLIKQQVEDEKEQGKKLQETIKKKGGAADVKKRKGVVKNRKTKTAMKRNKTLRKD